MVIDFLGNTIEVGDQVIYTPNTQSNELILAEVLDLKPFVRYGNRKNEETGRYESYELDTPGYKPHLQPLKSTGNYRNRGWKGGTFVPTIARKVFLGDCSGMMLYKKKEN